MDDIRILLLGGTGQIGHELRRTLAPLGAVDAPDRSAVDLTDTDALRNVVREERPDAIINAAAYTDVDGAEDEPDRAAAINARAPGILAEETARVDGLLVHYSTDYVFDGTKTTPYVETDAPNPMNTYGRTKWEGEQAVKEAGGRLLILRTSWVYSDRRSNFLLSMLGLADEHERLTVVDDQMGTPTWAGWIAEATGTILRSVFRGDDENLGRYHLAAEGQTSWYGFAEAIFAQYGRDDLIVEPVSSDEYPTAASRPAYTTLDAGAARRTFDLAIPTWTEQLDALRRRMMDSEDISA